ncbi:conserved hypothetical protein [Theileria equi strain WA]|uniref:DNA mismatch repair proteins mutS family domain-containing protein n=1 Tax=Theileria equi strain WA TaxID=1537102 RepID=L1LEV6_THEEQ|nr:conserved hypothetical protein [Theileria equi strain WA]EKX73760.1 conserved hypothetical protein [Theileria equi strain WA]|eukprot:XP_004833212.1 conserved hypothetical protein [Theileria equi strain WA]
MKIKCGQFYIDEFWRWLLLTRVPIQRNRVPLVESLLISRQFSSNHPLANNVSPLIDSNIINIKNERAKRLLEELSSKHPYLCSSKTSGIVDFVRKAKDKHKGSLILIRNGRTYQAFGTDAIIFVEHADLTPIGNTPHIEFDQSELQGILDKLINRGIDVVIYQQVTTTGLSFTNTETMSSQSFALSQIISRDAPIYSVDLEDGDILSNLTSNDKGVIGIAHGKSGFSISLINLQEKTVEIHKNLTMLNAIDVISSNFSRVMILQDTSTKVNMLFRQFPFVIYYQTLQGLYEDEEFHKAACDHIARRLKISPNFKLSENKREDNNAFNLNLECAIALGLYEYGSKSIGLHDFVLPKDSLPCTKGYMKLLMLKPPPENIRESIRYINLKLSTLNVPLLKLKPLSTTNMNSLCSNSKVDPQFYKDIYHDLMAFNHYMDSLSTKLVKNIFNVVMHDLKLNYKLGPLQKNIKNALKIIEYFIKIDSSELPIPLTNVKALDKFFAEMEYLVGQFHEDIVKKQLEKVDSAASELLNSISSDYFGSRVSNGDIYKLTNSKDIREKVSRKLEKTIKRMSITPSIMVNKHSIFLEKPNEYMDSTKMYTIEIKLKNQLKKWYISHNVERFLANYKNVCNAVHLQIDEILTSMTRMLSPYSQSIEIAFHFLVVLQTFVSHVSIANSGGWVLPTISSDKKILIRNLKPFFVNTYAIPMNIETCGLTIVTGPNNIGKTTSLLSVLASSLMSNIGLYLPCDSAQIPAFNNYFFLSPSCINDTTRSTLQNNSSIISLLNNATTNSLVILDNPGADTFFNKSIGIIAVIIDELSKIDCISMISTHNCKYVMEMVKRSGNLPFYKQLIKTNKVITLEEGHYENVGSELVTNELDEKVNKYLACYAKLDDNMNSSESISIPYTNEKPKDTKRDRRSDTNIRKIIGKQQGYLSNAMTIVLRCIEDLECCNMEKDVIHLIPDSIPPPSYNYIPVLYVIMIPVETDRSNERGVGVYVGESGNIIARLVAHRSKKSTSVTRYFEDTYMKNEKEMTEYLLHKNNFSDNDQKGILNWDKSHALIVRLKTRRETKLYEKRLIKSMYKYYKQITILSHRDGGDRIISALD